MSRQPISGSIARASRSSVSPSISGMLRSLTRTAGGATRTALNASPGMANAVTKNPAFSSAFWIASREAASSSTT
jgi:hypothetical protein